jgi:prepilin-type N-terminal cleavage/methylation domain-containing protein
MPRRSRWLPALQTRFAGECLGRSSTRGTTLVELIVVLAIIAVMVAIAMPTFKNSFSSANLSSATSAVTGAIQSTRYRAVVSGCNCELIFSQGNTTYQLAAYTLSGTPPICASTYTNVGSPIAWSAAGDGVSLQASTTLQFQPNGMVTLISGGSTGCATNALSCLRLSNGSTTNTINISGVGNVSVTTP